MAAVSSFETMYSYMASTLSYRVVAVCLLSVPFTHGAGLYVKHPRGAGLKGHGGNRHVLLAGLSYLLWGFAALTILPVACSMLPVQYSLVKEFPTIPHSHVDVVSGAAAAIAFIGELFMIKAMLVYDDKHNPGQQGHLSKYRPVLASAVVVVLGLLLSITGFLLLMALEYMPDLPSRVLYCCLSLSCLLIASSTTYGLGGHLRYGSRTQSSAMWQFFQPFAGGTAFVTTQAISWSIFSATVVMLVVLLQQLVAGVAHCFRCWALGAGSCMVIAQTMLGISLLTFRNPKHTASKLIRAASGALAPPKQGWMGANMPVLLMYLPVHTFFTLWVLSFVFLPQRVAVGLWVSFLVPYYLFTHWGNPAHTGCRQWPWLMRWFEANVEGALQHWFGSLTVVYDGDPAAPSAGRPAAAESKEQPAPAADQVARQAQQLIQQDDVLQELLPPEGSEAKAVNEQKASAPQRYMFGFQPHGLYPTGAGFLPWMPSFTRWFNGLKPITLTASVIFFPPFIRDIACWAGFRQVSKHTFLATLKERGAVLFCPGGQAEMVHAWRAFRPGDKRELVLHTRHRGFCRIAIEQQASLVPVLALGEALQLRNLYDIPSLQQYTYRRLGFPVPFILCGRWGVTPFPRKVPLVYVVGKPIAVPAHTAGEQVEASDVDAVHKQYYDSLVDLFKRYQHLHPDFANARLVLTDD